MNKNKLLMLSLRKKTMVLMLLLLLIGFGVATAEAKRKRPRCNEIAQRYNVTLTTRSFEDITYTLSFLGNTRSPTITIDALNLNNNNHYGGYATRTCRTFSIDLPVITDLNLGGPLIQLDYVCNATIPKEGPIYGSCTFNDYVPLAGQRLTDSASFIAYPF